MLEKIIRQIEKELKDNGYRENDNVDNTTKRDLIERSDLKRALDYRFSNCTEVNIEEIHKLSKYGVIRDVIEKYLETNNIIITTEDYDDVDEELDEFDEIDRDIKISNHSNSKMDILTQYYQDISKIPLLTSEEEVELFMKKKELEDDMNSIAKLVWPRIIKELSININCIPRSCLKDIKEFYSKQSETLNKIKEIDNKLQMVGDSESLKDEREQLKSYYKYYELEIANTICAKLVEEKNNGSTNIPYSCINLIKEYEPLNEKHKKIRERIINANLRLVVSVAVKYASKEEKTFSVADLIQEGNFGLIKALDRFDVTKGYKFSTYATWWIRQSITRSKADYGRTIRVPVHVVESVYKLYRLKSLMTQELNRDPSNKELAEALNISVEKVEDILKVGQEPASLYSVVGEDDDSYLIDFIPDEDYVTEENADQQELHKVAMEVLDTLSDREKRIIILRFGLDGKDPRTLQEVGNEFNVTRERIRQIEAKALRRMRHPSRSRKLKDFLK